MIGLLILCSMTDETKEVGYANVVPVKLRQSRMKAMSTSEPPANQGILTLVTICTITDVRRHDFRLFQRQEVH